MKEHNDYAEMGLRTIKRTAKKAYEDARKDNLEVPIWRNNRVEYITPQKSLEEAERTV